MSRRNPETTTPVFRFARFVPDDGRKRLDDMVDITWERRADGSPTAQTLRKVVLFLEEMLEGRLVPSAEIHVLDTGRREKISAAKALALWKSDMLDRLELVRRGRAETVADKAARLRIEKLTGIDQTEMPWSRGLPNDETLTAWSYQVRDTLLASYAWDER